MCLKIVTGKYPTPRTAAINEIYSLPMNHAETRERVNMSRQTDWCFETAADFDNALDTYADYLRDIGGRNDATIAWHILYLGRFLRHALSQRLTPQMLRPSHLIDYLREKRLSYSCANKTRIAVKAWFHYLLDLRCLRDNLFQDLPCPKGPDKCYRFYTPQEINRLLAACDTQRIIGLRDRTILEVLYDTGIRSHELCGLHLTDVDMHNATLRVRGKRHRERMLPLNQGAITWLRNYLTRRSELFGERKSATAVLFPSSLTGGMMRNTTLWKIVKKYVRAAGIDPAFTTHSLRHAFASHLMENGADLRVVQLLLGHTVAATTQLYTQLRDNHLEELHRRYHPRA